MVLENEDAGADGGAATASGGAAFGLALLFAVGDEVAAASGFLEDAVALDDFVEASDEAFAVFAVASSDLEQGRVLHRVSSERSWWLRRRSSLRTVALGLVERQLRG